MVDISVAVAPQEMQMRKQKQARLQLSGLSDFADRISEYKTPDFEIRCNYTEDAETLFDPLELWLGVDSFIALMGPGAIGKDYICNAIRTVAAQEKAKGNSAWKYSFRQFPMWTTRPLRGDEVQGKQIVSVSESRFRSAEDNGELLFSYAIGKSGTARRKFTGMPINAAPDIPHSVGLHEVMVSGDVWLVILSALAYPLLHRVLPLTRSIVPVVRPEVHARYLGMRGLTPEDQIEKNALGFIWNSSAKIVVPAVSIIRNEPWQIHKLLTTRGLTGTTKIRMDSHSKTYNDERDLRDFLLQTKMSEHTLDWTWLGNELSRK